MSLRSVAVLAQPCYRPLVRSGTWVVALASCVMAVGTAGCRSSDDPDVARQEVGPEGGVVSSIDSILTITIRPGALEESILLTIERSDEPPEVYGPAFRVRPNVELAVPATVTYRYPLPDDTSEVAVGYVDAEEFEAGQGRWRPLPLANLDPVREQVTGVDERISLFYGLLDDAPYIPPATTTDDPMTGDGTTGGPDESTGGTTSDDPSTGSATTDPDTSAGPTTDSGETDEGSTDTSAGSTTGMVDPCMNLPMGPLPVDEFMFTGTPLDGNSEDMTFSTVGTIITRNGAALVQIDPAGNVTNIPTSMPLPDTLGTRWTPAGNLVTAAYSGELLQIQPDGTVTSLYGGLMIPNGVFVALDGNIFFTDFNVPLAGFIDPTGTTYTELGNGGIESPQANGIVYDPDRDFVFYVSYGQGILWRVDVSDLGNPGNPQNILMIPTTGVGDSIGLDGLALDACGNLYIVDQNTGDPGSLFRVQLDAAGNVVGGAADLLVEAFPAGIANAVFAQGPGWGAYDTSLFTIGLPGRIFYVDVGVPGAPTPVAP